MSLTDKLQFTYLMMLCCTLNSIHGEDEGFFPSCKAELKVPRGTAWKAAPQQPVTAQCPVKHCGESLNVTWCKLSINQCEPINDTEELEITQTYTGDQLISHLTFKIISISDDGLYRCCLEGSKSSDISHTINISVSDMNQGVEYYSSQAYAAQRLRPPPPRGASWLPYLLICFTVAFLVTAMTVLTHLSFHDWRQTLNCSPSHAQVTSSSTIPGLPKRTDPSSPVLQAHFPVLNDMCHPHTSGTRPTPSPTTPSGIQHQANTADKSEAPDCAVYAVINHKQHRSPARKTQANSPEYSTISVS